MRINHDITFIDRKGQSFNALVKSSRESGHGEPLVTLIYNAPPTGEPQEVIDVPHISHPSRQENNPELPSYPLHAWKHEEEEHRELPEDHPVHDHFNEQPKKDEQGNIIPKRRPHYEAHIAQHRAGKELAGWRVGDGTDPKFLRDAEVMRHNQTRGTHLANMDGGELPAGTGPKPPVGSAAEAALNAGISVGHPAHPETVKFPFACDSCGASVTRTASHHGGKQYDVQTTGVNEDGSTKATNPLYVEHVCKQADIDAFRKKIEDAKKPAVVEPSAAERLAAGEQLSPEVEPPETEEGIEIVEPSASERMSLDAYFAPPKETDVIAELEKSPPAPSETEKPEDAA